MSPAATRIAVVTASYQGHRTYGDSLVAALSALPSVDVKRFDVGRSLFNRVAGFRVPLSKGVDLHAIRRHWAFDIELRGMASRLMADYDLIHVMPSPLALPFARARHREPGKAVLSVAFDCTARLMRDELGANPIQERLRERLEATTLRSADHVVCLSSWARASIRSYALVPDERIDVVPPSTHIVELPVRRTGGGHLPKIAFVGYPWKRKGGDRLLQWHRERWADECELHVLCRDAPRDVAPQRNVTLHAPMTRDEVIRTFLPSCDIFVLPTRRDQSPWVVAEAAGAGLPVVASAVGSISELVNHGTTGYLVEPTDDAGFVTAVEALLGDAFLCQRMGAAAREHAEEFLDSDVNFSTLAGTLASRPMLVALSPRHRGASATGPAAP